MPRVGYDIKGRKAGDLELMGSDLATTANPPTGGSRVRTLWEGWTPSDDISSRSKAPVVPEGDFM